MEIRFANESDKKEIIFLWEKIFGDDKDFIEDFYLCCDINENTLVADDNGKIAGFLNFPEISLYTGEKSYRGIYVFAACVAENSRRRGYFGNLMRYLDAVAAKRNYSFCMLIPANDELFSMYEKMGFREKCVCFYPFDTDISLLENTKTLDEIYSLYIGKCRKSPSFVKDKRLFGLSLVNLLENGYLLGEKGKDYFLYKKSSDGKITVFDTSADFILTPKKYGVYKFYGENIGKVENITYNLFLDV